jgi:hypothetical protein
MLNNRVRSMRYRAPRTSPRTPHRGRSVSGSAAAPRELNPDPAAPCRPQHPSVARTSQVEGDVVVVRPTNRARALVDPTRF